MSDDVFDSVLIARVDSKSYQPPREGYKDGTTWIRLAGAAVTLRAVGDLAAQLPTDGEWAAFQLRGSRSGSIPLVVGWGWVNEISSLYNGSPKTDIQWMATFGRNGASVGGGVKPPGNGVHK